MQLHHFDKNVKIEKQLDYKYLSEKVEKHTNQQPYKTGPIQNLMSSATTSIVCVPIYKNYTKEFVAPRKLLNETCFIVKT